GDEDAGVDDDGDNDGDWEPEDEKGRRRRKRKRRRKTAAAPRQTERSWPTKDWLDGFDLRKWLLVNSQVAAQQLLVFLSAADLSALEATCKDLAGRWDASWRVLFARRFPHVLRRFRMGRGAPPKELFLFTSKMEEAFMPRWVRPRRPGLTSFRSFSRFERTTNLPPPKNRITAVKLSSTEKERQFAAPSVAVSTALGMGLWVYDLFNDGAQAIETQDTLRSCNLCGVFGDATILAGDVSGNIRFFTHRGDILQELDVIADAHSTSVMCVEPDWERARLTSCCRRGIVEQWDLQTLQRMNTPAELKGMRVISKQGVLHAHDRSTNGWLSWDLRQRCVVHHLPSVTLDPGLFDVADAVVLTASTDGHFVRIVDHDPILPSELFDPTLNFAYEDHFEPIRQRSIP
ncbi:Hypothetical protein SCF082_LOCUS28345, partial [Durusdinium trenchii]